MGYAFWADVIVALHLAYVGFVVVGELIIVVGALCGWRWVRNPWFRLVHLAMIGIVAYEAFFNINCPLTDWENALRELAGQQTGTETFVGRLVHFLFLDGENPWEPWVYNALHMGFGALVLGTLLLVPPRWSGLKRRRRQGPDDAEQVPAAA
jgi:hypothetical protein